MQPQLCTQLSPSMEHTENRNKTKEPLFFSLFLFVFCSVVSVNTQRLFSAWCCVPQVVAASVSQGGSRNIMWLVESPLVSFPSAENQCLWLLSYTHTHTCTHAHASNRRSELWCENINALCTFWRITVKLGVAQPSRNSACKCWMGDYQGVFLQLFRPLIVFTVLIMPCTCTTMPKNSASSHPPPNRSQQRPTDVRQSK